MPFPTLSSPPLHSATLPPEVRSCPTTNWVIQWSPNWHLCLEACPLHPILSLYYHSSNLLKKTNLMSLLYLNPYNGSLLSIWWHPNFWALQICTHDPAPLIFWPLSHLFFRVYSHKISYCFSDVFTYVCHLCLFVFGCGLSFPISLSLSIVYHPPNYMSIILGTCVSPPLG